MVTPFAGRTKCEVLDVGRQFAIGLTFSCIAPRLERHCGRCNKCAERRLAFVRAGCPDPTVYHRERPCSA
ncbi:MAG: 7-cyano-7-deazaguanine synthase [Gemmataceae bacterium]